MSAVYIVSKGDYSDWTIVGVFSSKKKAEEYRDTMKRIRGEYYSDINDEIDEYTVDAPIMPNAVALSVDLESGEVERAEPWRPAEEGRRWSNAYLVYVNFQPDAERMRKAAIDRANMLKAREAGV